MYNFDDYTFIIYQTEEEYYREVPEHRFVAYLKEIPEASLHEYGATKIEALDNLSEQFLFLQKKCNAKKIYFPCPLSRNENAYSGRLGLRMPKWLHRDIALQSDQEGLSQNTFIVNQLIKATTIHSVQNIMRESLKKMFQEPCSQFPCKCKYAEFEMQETEIKINSESPKNMRTFQKLRESNFQIYEGGKAQNA